MTYVIADGGACHDGDLEKQKDLVLAAAAAGCNAFKTQWTSSPERMAARRNAGPNYEAIYRKYLAFHLSWHEVIAALCAARGIDYMCTVFLPEDVTVIAPHVKRFKVSSFEAQDRELALAYTPFQQPVIVSTGMLNYQQVCALRFDWNVYVEPERQIQLLQCVSAYPCTPDDLHLALLLQSNGDIDDPLFHGLSDHTHPAETWTGALAVAAGAYMVEAHLKLDGTWHQNPDAPHAMTPNQFSAYVRNIRYAERCVGNGEKNVLPDEQAMLRYKVQA